jgi:hypothetical protein
MPGRATVEFRSVTGRMGAYGGMPYYPPAFAEEVLAKRVRHPRGYPIPAPEHRLPLVLFHLCYHKAEASGIPTGVDLPTGVGKYDYAAKLRAVARAEGAALPEPLTLARCDELRARGTCARSPRARSSARRGSTSSGANRALRAAVVVPR